MIFIIENKKHEKYEVLIDKEDCEEFKKYKWFINKPKNKNTAYVLRSIVKNNKKTTISLHSQLTGYKMADHINGNGLDCRRSNMREAIGSQNNMNTKIYRNNTSGYKGVTLVKDRKKWRARIQINNKYKSIGEYYNKDQAAIAYNIAALNYFGEFAKLNNVMKDSRYE